MKETIRHEPMTADDVAATARFLQLALYDHAKREIDCDAKRCAQAAAWEDR